MTSANYETGLAATDDIPAILAMQEVSLHENGGGLSVRQTLTDLGAQCRKCRSLLRGVTA